MDERAVKSSGLTSKFSVSIETVTLYRPLMATHLRRMFRLDEATIDDILQESFLSAFKAQDSFVPAGDNATANWLLTIAERKARDYLRSARRNPVKNISIESMAEPGQRDRAVSDVAGLQILEKLLRAKLHPEEKACLDYGLDAESYEELAARNGVPVANIKTKIHRGRGRLIKALNLEPQDFQLPVEAYDYN